MPDKLSAEEKKLLRKIDKEKSENTIYTSFFETDSFILEQICPIDNQSATRATRATDATDTNFIFYDKKTGSIDYLPDFAYHGKTICPIVDDMVANGVIKLPSGIEEYGETRDLINDIHEFLHKNFEVPEFYEEFLPYIALFYWVYERFPFVPYIHFVGLTGTGKTTAQEVFGSICYKPIDASGAITMSPVFRMASMWRGTLLLDEFEPNSDGFSEMIAFLKSGVGNKAVLRTEGDTKREVRAYMIKSPKIFTSEVPINNSGLRSRMFVIQMQKNKRRIPLFRLKGFEDEAISIRNKLLLWRLRNIDKIDLQSIEYGYPELAGFDGRVQQVITPIYFLSDEDTKATILRFAVTQEQETKTERLDSLDGQIFQIISDSFPVDVTVKQIADEINKDRGRKPLTEKRIANTIRKILQFTIIREGHDNVSTVQAANNKQRVDDLRTYFGLPSSERVASVASVANGTLAHTDVPENATHAENMDATHLYYSDLADKTDPI